MTITNVREAFYEGEIEASTLLNIIDEKDAAIAQLSDALSLIMEMQLRGFVVLGEIASDKACRALANATGELK